MFYEKERIYKSDLGTNHLELCVNLTALARELSIDQKSLLEFLDTHSAMSIIRKAIVSEMEQKKVLCPICGYQLGQFVRITGSTRLWRSGAFGYSKASATSSTP